MQSGAGGRNPNKVLLITAVARRCDFLQTSSGTVKEGLFGAGDIRGNQTKHKLMPLKFPETAGQLFSSQPSHLLVPEQRGKITLTAPRKTGMVCRKGMWYCRFCSVRFFQEWKALLLSYTLTFLVIQVFGSQLIAPSCLPICYKGSSNPKRL